jgi:hypothetical protein
MPRQPVPTDRQREIDRAVLCKLEENAAADYRELAAAAGTSTAQIKESLDRLGLPANRTERAELAGYARGWNAAVQALGNIDG